MNRNFMILLSLIVVGLIGVFIALGGKDDSGAGGKTLENPRVIQADDLVKGSGTAAVTLIEYGDFECPGCQALFPLLLQLEAELGTQIDIVFRHFPLSTIHPNAFAAHRAAQAAANQGKFFEMHDILYERQASWRAQAATQTQAIEAFEVYADEIGLDMDQYLAEVNSGEVFDFINAHIQSGNELGFTGTPSLLLNGEEIATPRSYEELRNVIQEELNKVAETQTETTSEGGTDEPESTEATDETPEPEAAQ